ncbi:ABC transporter permease [Paracoccus sp. TK19116]|uniref:ABC transporter permease n=1 Tax=Paracoccus albicereus TaxID=2922394 RepID=A0ABT1MSE4_9RHOB|nr:ABC transporter permease [Paracoccus albicereus]
MSTTETPPPSIAAIPPFPRVAASKNRATPTLRPVTRRRSWGSGRAIGALVLREMSTSYGRVSGGYLWAIAEPVGGIMILAIIFSLGFRNPPIGTNFAIFYATGLVPFLFYSDISQKLSQAIQFSRSLLAYPAVTFMDAILGRLFTNVVTQLLVAYIVFAGITLTMETRTDPQLPEIALSLAMAGVLGLGIGVLNCFLFTGFPWWQKVWMILNRPLMIASCVIFMFDTVPQPWRDWLWWNPLVHVVGQMRKAFYPSYSGDYVSPAYVFGVGLICLTLGLTLLLRYHRDLLNG